MTNDADKRSRKKVILGCAVAGAAAAVIVFSLAFWENRSDASTVGQVHEPVEIFGSCLVPSIHRYDGGR